ncbi:MAG: peptidoglycan DD-metalloendopeptidase family protein [Alphaproteobacteria bacterium]|nr:peptidoglycan DD-metalloendopeptidase family protein [Alphaproteobacteria bacterium]MCB9974629.1 peptidoglycan DD-metalloendopeptidase family protein [Rhodospirillales bacterium]
MKNNGPKNLLKTVTLIGTLIIVTGSHVHAAPPPEKKAQTLDVYKEKIVAEKKSKTELEKKAETQNLEIQEIKDRLVQTAAQLREKEEAVRNTELEIQNLDARQQLIKTGLKQDRTSLSKLILALERLRRVPPEAMIARPDTPYKVAQSAMLMAEIAGQIQKEALALKNKLDELETISRDMKTRKELLVIELEQLQAHHKEIQTLVAQRERHYRKTHQDITAKEAEIQHLSLQSRNLEDLIKRLEKERLKKEKEEQEKELKKRKDEQKLANMPTPRVKPQPPQHQPARAFSGKLSPGQLPISGIIRIRYQEKDDLGAPSNGLTIEGRSGAMVLTPIDGKIQFAGAFKRYGNLIIIEHAKGYHSLVAGIGKIDAFVGQTVSAGEPLGLLPTIPAGSERPRLYYELRRNGTPVNPSVLFTELG